MFTIDSFGRRNLLLTTFPKMAWTLLAAGLCFLIPDDSAARVPLIAVFIYIFAAFYSSARDPCHSPTRRRFFPAHAPRGRRWAGPSRSAYSSRRFLSLTFPPHGGGHGPRRRFGFYAGLNVTAFVLIFFFLPETAGLQLEELDYVLWCAHGPARRVTSSTPGCPGSARGTFGGKKDAQLKPLYQLDEIQGIESDPTTSLPRWCRPLVVAAFCECNSAYFGPIIQSALHPCAVLLRRVIMLSVIRTITACVDGLHEGMA